MDGGRIVGAGSDSELMQGCELYRNLRLSSCLPVLGPADVDGGGERAGAKEAPWERGGTGDEPDRSVPRASCRLLFREASMAGVSIAGNGGQDIQIDLSLRRREV